jgi:site-specific DNA recombinase
MTRAAIYARYSSDNQREASIEDQVRQCRARIYQESWQRGEVYSDHAVSGATILRPGYQKMLEDARAGRFEVLVAEALDRLSRDQENIAGLFKQLSFAGVKLITLSEGEIGELHVGLKGTMNALFLKDLAQKTRRGLEGRIRQGKSGGGRCFGYEVVRSVNHSSEPIRGERRINQTEAEIVRRIFEEFAKGRSPRAIAGALNKEAVSGPAGKTWGPSTIYGNWRRGTGILNNELYVGRLVWNRQQFVKDPHTGRRQARLNPEIKRIVEKVPHLRIVDDQLWDLVQACRSKLMTPDKGMRSEHARRPRYLLSGLLKCGTCGSGFSKISQTHYGCSSARN